MTGVELAVLCAAFNYARTFWFLLPVTVSIVDEHNQSVEYSEFVSHFHEFVGKHALTSEKGLVRTTEKQQAVYGRIFLSSVFEALELFARNPIKASRPRIMRDGVEVIVDYISDEFHHVPGYNPGAEKFQETAKYMFCTGVLGATGCPLKKSFEKLPNAFVDLRRPEAVAKFVTRSMKCLRKEIGHYIDELLALPEGDDGEMSDVSSVDGLEYSANHGFFDLPRNTEGVLKFYDVGFNFHPGDTEFSFLPSGIHSVWLVNFIMSGRRFNAGGTQTAREPGTNHDLFVRLQHIENQELLQEIRDTILDNEEFFGDEENIEDEWERLVNERPIHEMERELLDMIQEHVELSQVDAGDETTHDVEEILRLVSKSKFTSYPVYGTNGMYSNVHTGKFVIVVERDGDDEFARVKLSLLVRVGDSCILGMQIYSSFTRKTSRKRVTKGQIDMIRFPTIVRAILFPHEFLHETFQYTKLLKEFVDMMSWLEMHKNSYVNELTSMNNLGIRVEFFCEHRPQSYDMDEENLKEMPCLSTCLRTVKTVDLKKYLRKSLVEPYSVLANLKDKISGHMAMNQLPALTTINVTCRAGMVLISELMVAKLDFLPFRPRQLMAVSEQFADKTGSWKIHEDLHENISEDDKTQTGMQYGIDPGLLKHRVRISSFGEGNFFSCKNADSQLLTMAYRMKGIVRIPIHYLQALDRIRAILFHFSQSSPGNPFEVITNADGEIAPVVPVSSSVIFVDIPFDRK